MLFKAYATSVKKKILREAFGPELIRIDQLIKTAQSAVKNCAERDFFFCGVSREFLQT